MALGETPALPRDSPAGSLDFGGRETEPSGVSRPAGITAKSIALVFLSVVVLYLATFFGIEWLRHRRGPWEIAFDINGNQEPVITISQPTLGISGVRLVVHGDRATNSPGVVRFSRVQQPVPFGRVIYEDLTFLPGVVTLDLFGHEVELLPRLLVVNQKQVPWRSSTEIELWPTNKPAIPPHPPQHR